MKKLFFAAIVALCATSCNTIRTSTATTLEVFPTVTSENVADLKVSDKRESFTWTPESKAEAKFKATAAKRSAVYALLEKTGGDILVEPRYEVKIKYGLFSKKLVEVKVSGRPASMTNYRPAPVVKKCEHPEPKCCCCKK